MCHLYPSDFAIYDLYQEYDLNISQICPEAYWNLKSNKVLLTNALLHVNHYIFLTVFFFQRAQEFLWNSPVWKRSWFVCYSNINNDVQNEYSENVLQGWKDLQALPKVEHGVIL